MKKFIYYLSFAFIMSFSCQSVIQACNIDVVSTVNGDAYVAGTEATDTIKVTLSVTDCDEDYEVQVSLDNGNSFSTLIEYPDSGYFLNFVQKGRFETIFRIVEKESEPENVLFSHPMINYVVEEVEVGVEEDNVFGMKIYPTLVDDFITIQHAAGVQVILYSASGTCIKAQHIVSDSVTWDVSSLISGYYFIMSSDGKTYQFLKR